MYILKPPYLYTCTLPLSFGQGSFQGVSTMLMQHCLVKITCFGLAGYLPSQNHFGQPAK